MYFYPGRIRTKNHPIHFYWEECMEPINLLFTLENRYIPQLQVLLTSLWINNPEETFHIYLMHRGLTDFNIQLIHGQCLMFGYTFSPVHVDSSFFLNAPVSKQYPQEMYDRLLAAQLLPQDLKKIIYLDPDILIINPLRPLWEKDLSGKLFAAAAHSGKTELVHTVNRVRLKTQHDYLLLVLHHNAVDYIPV